MESNNIVREMIALAKKNGGRIGELVLSLDASLRGGRGNIPTRWQTPLRCHNCGHLVGRKNDFGICVKCGAERFEHGPRRCHRCGDEDA
jgi:ribosomal protein L40E